MESWEGVCLCWKGVGLLGRCGSMLERGVSMLERVSATDRPKMKMKKTSPLERRGWSKRW